MVRMSELRCREVINVCDGCRLGFVEDLELDCTGGNIVALVVPGRAKLFGLLGREEDIVIPWDKIKLIGDDTVLVDYALRLPPKRRRSLLSGFIEIT